MSEPVQEYEFEVWQDGIMVACVSSSRLEDARRETLHYAFVYAQDGEVQISGEHADKLFGLFGRPASHHRGEG